LGTAVVASAFPSSAASSSDVGALSLPIKQRRRLCHLPTGVASPYSCTVPPPVRYNWCQKPDSWWITKHYR
jgi:hypothetical protein